MGKPRMVVTGGSGYLGQRVVRLAKPGWDVIATYHSSQLSEEGVTWLPLDVRDSPQVTAVVAGFRPAVIVHTAAANPGSGGDFDAVNGVGSANIVRTAKACGARLVHLSTDVLFDGQKGSYTEDDPPSPITPYGSSKAAAEEAVGEAGGNAVVVRTSLIYGWQPYIDRHTGWVVEALRAGEPVHLFTDELRCPIWVESLAAAVVELAGNDYAGVLHVAGAQALSRYDFGLRMLQAHGIDGSSVTPASARECGQLRPLDCTLDSSRARALLATPLPGVDEILSHRAS